MLSISKPSLADQVYDELRGAIIMGEFPPGAKLNVNELQGQMGVSCTPIREAVKRLQQDGLVEYENNIGARVISLEEHDVVEIQQLAMTLHDAAIRLSMENGNRQAMLKDLRRRFEEYNKAKTSRAKMAAISDFVGVYYHHCGNRRLDNSMLSIQGQQHLLRGIYVKKLPQNSADMLMFERMIDATERNDAEGVCAALQEYTDKMTDSLIQWIRNEG
ncbi:MAG: GntR family transcriptional regulator [Oscillospiraceae bacterium]|nr:GntR family transcriptional regulator [Oscillospiraceae bacterium]